MRLFTIDEARYFCASFSASSGASQGSLDLFQTTHLAGGTRILSEGTSIFDQFRDCSLRNVERSLFFAASQYRRALDLMTKSSSPWAHVTLYYGNWHTAHALIGMFGSAVLKKSAVGVSRGDPGRQQVILKGIGQKASDEYTTYKGSHQRFWDLFYKTVLGLRPFVQPQFAAVLIPVNGDPTWQTERRNEVNYDTAIGLNLAQDFARSFSKAAFPTSLPGALATQFGIFETMLTLANSYATEFGLRTDALDQLGAPGNLRSKVGTMVYGEKSPALVRQTKKSAVT